MDILTLRVRVCFKCSYIVILYFILKYNKMIYGRPLWALKKWQVSEFRGPNREYAVGIFLKDHKITRKSRWHFWDLTGHMEFGIFQKSFYESILVNLKLTMKDSWSRKFVTSWELPRTFVLTVLCVLYKLFRILIIFENKFCLKWCLHKCVYFN